MTGTKRILDETAAQRGRQNFEDAAMLDQQEIASHMPGYTSFDPAQEAITRRRAAAAELAETDEGAEIARGWRAPDVRDEER